MKLPIIAVAIGMFCGWLTSSHLAMAAEPSLISITSTSAFPSNPTVVKINSSRGPVEVEVHVESFHGSDLRGNPFRTPIAWFYVPTTSNLWYQASPGVQGEGYWRMDLCWLIHGMGIARLYASGDFVVIVVCQETAKDIVSAKEVVLRGGTNCFDRDGVWRPCHQFAKVRVMPFLGKGFTELPVDPNSRIQQSFEASDPRPSKIIAVKCADKKWTIEMVSAYTGETAVMELDESFKLLKLTRAGKQVFPK